MFQKFFIKAPPTVASPSGSFPRVPRHLGLGRGGPVCGPPPCHSCRGARTSNFTDSCSLCSGHLCRPHPHPAVRAANGVSSATLNSAAAIFLVDITAGPSPSGTVSPAMSATEEHDWMPVPVPKSVLYFTKEASEYQCEESDEEVQEAEGEEEDSDKKKTRRRT